MKIYFLTAFSLFLLNCPANEKQVTEDSSNEQYQLLLQQANSAIKNDDKHQISLI